MEWLTPITTILVGGGVIRVLYLMRGELSCLKGEFISFRKNVQKDVDDHETRIRTLEKE